MLCRHHRIIQILVIICLVPVSINPIASVHAQEGPCDDIGTVRMGFQEHSGGAVLEETTPLAVLVPRGSPRKSTLHAALVPNLTEGAGVQGWSLSLAVQGAIVATSATTRGTAAALVDDDPPGLRQQSSFEFTTIIDPADNNGQRGIVSAVVLANLDPVALPPGGPSTVLTFAVEAEDLGATIQEGTINCQDGLVGGDEPSRNIYTSQGETYAFCDCSTLNIRFLADVSVTPIEGTLGTILTVTGSEFGVAKPKIVFKGFNELNARQFNGKLRMISYTETEIVAEVRKARQGFFKVGVKPRKKPLFFIDELVEIKPPVAFGVPGVDPDNPSSVAPLDEVTLEGQFFGNRKIKIRVGGKKAPLVDRNQISVTFLVPRKLGNGIYDVEVSNRIGSTLIPGAVHVVIPEEVP